MAYSHVFKGPSNAGKTYWRMKFQQEGFECVGVDDEIELRLGPYLERHGYKGIADVSKWMGQPYEARYDQNSKIYLRYEREVMLEVIDRLEDDEDLVVDTTGSVIYTGQDVLDRLMSLARVSAFGIPTHVEDEMREQYFKNPKPVIWGDGTFSQNEGEGGEDALRRCYPNLLRTRLVKYQASAHRVLDYDTLRRPGFSVKDFLALTR